MVITVEVVMAIMEDVVVMMIKKKNQSRCCRNTIATFGHELTSYENIFYSLSVKRH